MPESAAAASASPTIAVSDDNGHVSSMEQSSVECARLRQALQLRDCALDAANSGFVIIDMQQRGRPIAYANRALAQRTGYSREELIGMPSAALTPADVNVEQALAIRDAMRAGKQLRIEYQTARKDGSLYWTGTTLVPVTDAAARITHYVSISADITTRRTAEQQSQRDRARLAAVVESALEAIVAVDDAEHITLFNRAAELMFARSAGDSLGQPLTTLVPEWFRASHREFMDDFSGVGALTRAISTPGLLVGLRPNGEEFPLEATISRASIDGDIVTTLFMRDVSEWQRAEQERAQLESQLRLSQKLEAVGQLAAGIAHEINTPIQYVGDSVLFLRTAREDSHKVLEAYRNALTAIENGATAASVRADIAAAEQAADTDFYTVEVPKAFERTLEGIEHVATIVRAMKDFSHPDAADHQEADLNRALETTLVVARNEYKYLAEVETHLHELPPVICNIGELNQVFLNLIVNAAHAIEESGKDVATGRIVISTDVDGEYVKIVATDNGCGIPKSNLDKVFDPFFTTKEVGKGTGQGLAITRSIVVVKHRGSVDIDSEVGVGTKFTLRLPIAGIRPQETSL